MSGTVGACEACAVQRACVPVNISIGTPFTTPIATCPSGSTVVIETLEMLSK